MSGSGSQRRLIQKPQLERVPRCARTTNTPAFTFFTWSQLSLSTTYLGRVQLCYFEGESLGVVESLSFSTNTIFPLQYRWEKGPIFFMISSTSSPQSPINSISTPFFSCGLTFVLHFFIYHHYYGEKYWAFKFYHSSCFFLKFIQLPTGSQRRH